MTDAYTHQSIGGSTLTYDQSISLGSSSGLWEGKGIGVTSDLTNATSKQTLAQMASAFLNLAHEITPIKDNTNNSGRKSDEEYGIDDGGNTDKFKITLKPGTPPTVAYEAQNYAQASELKEDFELPYFKNVLTILDFQLEQLLHHHHY